MKTTFKHGGFGRKVMALAILAAFGPAHAADDEVADLTQPGSSVGVGLGVVNGNTQDRSMFGQYNGLRDHKTNLLLDLDLVKRDDATGTWTTLKGRNLGFDNRELNATYEKQGDWKIGAGYDEITHHEIRTINTGDIGVGTTTPSVVRLATPGTGSDIDLKIERKAYGFSAEKWLSKSLFLEANFKSEDKDGMRLSGRGYDCATSVCQAGTGAVKNAILMQAEPINFNTKQFDLRLSFSDDKLNANAGYYGSFFTNSNGSVNMTVPNRLNNGAGASALLYNGAGNGTGTPAAGTTLQNVLQLPFALPPDNQSHQVYVDGNYAFTKTTKGTFKYAYTHATQHESFAGMGLTGAPAGVSDLGGVVNSTLFQLGLTAKPLPKLSLVANLRYDNKQDGTPKQLYNTENGARWFNADTSSSKLAGKFEASYQLPEQFRGTFGIDYNRVKREVPTSITVDQVAGLSALRERTNETGYRLELSRTMAESVTGTIGYVTSRRRGSDWTSLTTAANATYCGGVSCYGQTVTDAAQLVLSATSATASAIFPVSMADMNRDKWKLGVDWSPVEVLSVQFLVEDGKDKNVSAYSDAKAGRGFRNNDMSLYSVDVSYAVSKNWRLTGYASRGDQTIAVNHSGYMLDLKNTTDTLGIGAAGTLGRYEIGADLSYLNDTNKYGLSTTPGNVAPIPAQNAVGLPNVTFKQTVFNLYGKAAIDKHSDVRVDLIHQRNKLDEWSWGYNGVPFIYADNTTVKLKQDQSVTFIGARYIYKFR